MLSASLGPPLKKEKKRKKDLCSREDQDLTTNAFTLWKHDYTMLLCARREINYSCNTQIFFFSVPPCSCKRLGVIPGWNQHDEETIIIIGLLKLHSLLPLEAVEYSNHSQINRKKHWLEENVGEKNISYSQKVSRPQDIATENQQCSAAERLVWELRGSGERGIKKPWMII